MQEVNPSAFYSIVGLLVCSQESRRSSSSSTSTTTCPCSQERLENPSLQLIISGVLSEKPNVIIVYGHYNHHHHDHCMSLDKRKQRIVYSGIVCEK